LKGKEERERKEIECDLQGKSAAKNEMALEGLAAWRRGQWPELIGIHFLNFCLQM
jgi:hypothetical protein